MHAQRLQLRRHMDTQLTVSFGLETALLSQEELQGSTVCNACTTEAWGCLAQQDWMNLHSKL